MTLLTDICNGDTRDKRFIVLYPESLRPFTIVRTCIWFDSPFKIPGYDTIIWSIICRQDTLLNHAMLKNDEN